ncbi:MAG: hypothetical protein M3N91_14785 [Pseudomonadota bacterium]|nr:hypothetical protein [Pseudomonadota bacterium]
MSIPGLMSMPGLMTMAGPMPISRSARLAPLLPPDRSRITLISNPLSLLFPSLSWGSNRLA